MATVLVCFTNEDILYHIETWSPWDQHFWGAFIDKWLLYPGHSVQLGPGVSGHDKGHERIRTGGLSKSV